MTALDDLRYALRMLGKSPRFTLAVLATLALTISLSTTVFSVLDAVYVRRLPYNQPDRILYLRTYSPQNYTQPASYPEYLDWRRDTKSFSALAAYNNFGSVNFENGGIAVALPAVSSSDNFFQVFGVKPILGRTFANGEELPGRNFVVVLSNEVWRSVFGARPDAIGTKVKLDGVSYSVIGVMPAGFRFPISQTNAIYRPLNMTLMQRTGRGNHWLPTVGRLKPGITAQAAQQEFNRVLDQLGRIYPDAKGRRAKLIDLPSFTVGNTSAALRLLLYAVLALLAIGCVNIAGLLFARGVRMEREIAVRSALGASRARLVRQFLAETVLYAIAGGIAGIALAFGLLHTTSVLLIAALQRGAEIQINIPVLLVSLAVAIITSLVAGLVPALRISGVSANSVLRSGGRAGSAERGQHRLRAGFVVAQVALALVLLVTADLVFRSLSALQHAEFGFDPEHILTAEIDLSPGSYEHRAMIANFYLPMLERVQGIAGVKAAGLIQVVPIQNWGWNSDTHIAGYPPNSPNEERLAELRFVTPGYYGALGDRLVRCRLPDPSHDTPSSQRVAVVNEAFVKKFIHLGEDPIGKIIDSDEKVTIVGVVRDIRQSIYEPPLAEMDWPISQVPADMEVMVVGNMHVVLRTPAKPESVIPDLRAIFHQLDSTLPFREPETMAHVIAQALTFERLEDWLFATFAGLAVLLSLVGLYGLISHEVEASTRDIGVRMALGATRPRIFGMIYKRVGSMVSIGLACGLFATWALRTVIRAVLTLNWRHDAAAIAGVAALFAVVAILSAFVPARRAATVEPMESLRTE